MTSSAREIASALSRGKEVKHSDGSYSSLCPAHDDNSPSLSITENAQGRLLFHCHVGCTQQAVLDALRSQGLWKGAGRTWTTLDVAPETAAKPNGMLHYKHGAASNRWEYRNRKGQLVGYIYRFDLPNGKKELMPLAWCQAKEDGKTEWRWRSFNKLRPLYGEHLIDQEKGRPVLIVEGEKTTDAARLIFTDYLVITWPGGGGAVKLANWESLKGRDVILWPDADEPGTKCMATLAEILLSTGVKTIKLVELPDGLPIGWDLADPVPEGVKLDRRALVITAREFQPSGDSKIDELNAKLALTILGDKAVIIWEKWNPIHKRNIPSYVNLAAVKAYYANSFIQAGRKEMPVIDYWMQHPSRKSYHSVVFEPGHEEHGVYNLWRGFTVQPDPTGDWGILEEHLRLNIAQGDDDLYNWIFGWFAQMFQHPQRKPGTSLAIRGKQGSGKTVVGQHMGALIRDNYVLVNDPRYVVGNFNSHMGHALLLQADEGFFAGDPRHIGALKGLVTANTNRIELKGKDSFEINNYIRLMITSNSDWIVPTSFEERRFATVDCGEGRLQDKAFFKAMQAQMDAGGYEGLLHALLNFDLSTVDVGVIPKTLALADQKQQSLDPVAKVWFERIRDGELHTGEGRWDDFVGSEDLYQMYIKRALNWGVSRRVTDAQFGKELKVLMPGQRLDRVRRLQGVKDDYGNTTMKRVWGYAIQDLEECRKSFEAHLNIKVDWEAGVLPSQAEKEDHEMPF